MNDYILNFGTTVNCIEGQCGKLARIAFNPENYRVPNLIVEEGILLKHARVFPISIVEWATADEVNIAVYEEDLSRYPEYRKTYIEHVQEGNVEPALIQGSPYGLATSAPTVPVTREVLIEGVDDNLVLIDKSTPLEAVDGSAGKVHGVVVAPENGVITNILVHKGAIFAEAFLLSMTMVDHISSKGVFVNMTQAELDDLIEYEETREQYWDNLPTDAALEEPPPAADVESGYQAMVTRDDAALTAVIANVLMNDPRTEGAVIEVIHDRGMVTLQGTVDNLRTKQAAEEIVNSHPGVVSVSNELAVAH